MWLNQIRPPTTARTQMMTKLMSDMQKPEFQGTLEATMRELSGEGRKCRLFLFVCVLSTDIYVRLLFKTCTFTFHYEEICMHQLHSSPFDRRPIPLAGAQ